MKTNCNNKYNVFVQWYLNFLLPLISVNYWLRLWCVLNRDWTHLSFNLVCLGIKLLTPSNTHSTCNRNIINIPIAFRRRFSIHVSLYIRGPLYWVYPARRNKGLVNIIARNIGRRAPSHNYPSRDIYLTIEILNNFGQNIWSSPNKLMRYWYNPLGCMIKLCVYDQGVLKNERPLRP